jgi:hypothetical protein
MMRRGLEVDENTIKGWCALSSVNGYDPLIPWPVRSR